MALTANPIPSQITQLPVSWDAMTAFTDGQTLTATGYLNNLNSGQLDLGGTAGVANPISAAGRTDAIWTVNISAIDVSSSDETYQFGLLGSNDVAFGNGNVELLAFHDLAAAASGRVFANLLGASPAIPPNRRIAIPFTNLMQGINYRYLRARAVIGGTTPSITVSSWITRAQIRV